MSYLMLALGGALGTLSRYLLSGFMAQAFGKSYPLGTLTVNVLGCFAIGLFVALDKHKDLLGYHLYFLLVIGFCGAFTTFSAFILDNSLLLQSDHYLKSFSYIFLSIILCFITFTIGFWMGRT